MKTCILAGRMMWAAAICAVAVSAGGCTSLVQTVFGTEQGCLFVGCDSLALPGEEVPLQVQIRSGGFLKDRPGVTVHFSSEKGLQRDAVTDDEGFASVPFRPAAPGDYPVTVSVPPGTFHCPTAPTAEIWVACREPAAPLLIVDLDKTLVASGFRKVLVGTPRPMPLSQEVLDHLARDFTVVYLTHRVNLLGPKTKAWLRDNGFPRGPVLMADAHELLKGSGTFKGGVLSAIRKQFCGRAVGVGDLVSDALAYHQNGMEAFLLLHVKPDSDPEDLRKLARSLNVLPDSVRVVTGWDQIWRALTDGDTFFRPQVQQRLLRRADELQDARKRSVGSLTSSTPSRRSAS